MNQAKRRFIEEYIERIEKAIDAYEEADLPFPDVYANQMVDLLIEVRNVFQSDIPSIDNVFPLNKGTVVSDANSVLGILKYYLIDCDDDQGNCHLHSSPSVIGDKIFVSHRSVDKKFAEIIENFLTSCGVPSDKILCSSLPGNDIEEEISKEIKENLQQSGINIVLLSKDYYDSVYCLNEAGIIWYLDAHRIMIALPEIDENCMLGFLNSEHKIRRLDNMDDVYSITDIVKRFYPSFISSGAKLKSKIELLCSQYSQALDSRSIDSKTLYSDSKGYFYATIVEDRGLTNGYRCLRIDGLLPIDEPYKENETHWLFFTKDQYQNLKVNDRVKFKPTGRPQKLRDFSDIQNTRNIYIDHLEIL